ncbi:MAG: DUF6491 family protein [Pseudomonadaceae bacterium]|nr:DUF6491 family protein [Pseudomonadaceae bacterium]
MKRGQRTFSPAHVPAHSSTGGTWLKLFLLGLLLTPAASWASSDAVADAADESDETPAIDQSDDAAVEDLATVLSEVLPDDAYSGGVERCLSNHEYRNIEIVSDQYLLVRGSRGRAWVNELPRRCRGMRRDSILVTESRVGRICQSDLFRAMDRVDFGGPPIAHATCVFGVFQPVAADQVELIREALVAKSRTTTVKASAKGGK